MKRLLNSAALLFAGSLAPMSLTSHAHAGDDARSFSIENVEWLTEGGDISFGLLWGNWTTGPHGFLVRIPPGGSIPWHTHTEDYNAVTIQGQWVHIFGDGTEEVLPPGSWAFQVKEEFHGDRCIGEIECIVLVHQHGPRSFILPEEK